MMAFLYSRRALLRDAAARYTVRFYHARKLVQYAVKGMNCDPCSAQDPARPLGGRLRDARIAETVQLTNAGFKSQGQTHT
ncbi:hypothetical protein, partial [Pseudomonas viridiflava]|uniref:hypothetical protein n=1 Tax=Pseudomonas viridiflava TaxID=33069 RepID=UPI00197DDDEE